MVIIAAETAKCRFKRNLFRTFQANSLKATHDCNNVGLCKHCFHRGLRYIANKKTLLRFTDYYLLFENSEDKKYGTYISTKDT